VWSVYIKITYKKQQLLNILLTINNFQIATTYQQLEHLADRPHCDCKKKKKKKKKMNLLP